MYMPLPSTFLINVSASAIKHYQSLEYTCGLCVQGCAGRERLGSNFFDALAPSKQMLFWALNAVTVFYDLKSQDSLN
jgi:hypothetical protein